LEQIGNLTEVIEKLAADLEAASKTDEELRRLCTIPGIGPVTAGAVAAFAPDLDTFDSGRNFAASRDTRASGTTRRRATCAPPARRSASCLGNDPRAERPSSGR
ncbi:transposase, partial [Rhodovulum sp. 12E13]|uniref:transposase n=1 Tax=Rhodovulum sp. 12E13 TaxID=2203891 RepID=UPI0035159982